MATQTLELWDLVRWGPQVDPCDLARAVCEQAGETPLDYRTRLLIRDSVAALKAFWGESRVAKWLDGASVGETIRAICAQEYEEVGFPSLRRRLRDKTQPEQ